MSWDKGFNFRGDAAGPGGFPGDGANETWVAADIYPTTRNGVTFGWSAANSINRSGISDRRLCGINYGSTIQTFQVDLPAAADYQIQLALGDTADGSDNAALAVKDNSTTKFSITNFRHPSNLWTDAANVQYTDLTWPTSETPVQATFATTTLILGLSSPDGFWTLSHLFVSQVVVSANPVFIGRINLGHRPYPYAPGSPH